MTILARPGLNAARHAEPRLPEWITRLVAKNGNLVGFDGFGSDTAPFRLQEANGGGYHWMVRAGDLELVVAPGAVVSYSVDQGGDGSRITGSYQARLARRALLAGATTWSRGWLPLGQSQRTDSERGQLICRTGQSPRPHRAQLSDRCHPSPTAAATCRVSIRGRRRNRTVKVFTQNNLGATAGGEIYGRAR